MNEDDFEHAVFERLFEEEAAVFNQILMKPTYRPSTAAPTPKDGVYMPYKRSQEVLAPCTMKLIPANGDPNVQPLYLGGLNQPTEALTADITFNNELSVYEGRASYATYGDFPYQHMQRALLVPCDFQMKYESMTIYPQSKRDMKMQIHATLNYIIVDTWLDYGFSAPSHFQIESVQKISDRTICIHYNGKREIITLTESTYHQQKCGDFTFIFGTCGWRTYNQFHGWPVYIVPITTND